MKRDHTTRRFIGARQIVIVTKGRDMGKRGPKRKEGKREANGRMQRPNMSTMQRLNMANNADAKREKAVVLGQMHRRGSEDEWLAAASGRFCRAHGLDKAVYQACDEYMTCELRWLGGWGAPRGFEQHNGGSGAGATEAQMKYWLAKIKKVENALINKYGHEAYRKTRRMIVEDIDPHVDDFAMMRATVSEIAVTLEFLKENHHPLRG